MIDPVQAVLLFVIVLLTILFIVLGIQIFYILRDFRQSIRRTNTILENVENISKGISEPLSSLSGMFGNASTLTSVAKIISIFRKKKKD